MGLLNIGTFYLTFVTLLNFIELSSQEGEFFLRPSSSSPNLRVSPPSYVIENGIVRLTGQSVGGIIGAVDGYFLGTVENHVYHPVNPNDEQEVILLRTGSFVRVDEDFRRQLQNSFLNQIIRNHQQRRRNHGGAT